MTRETIKVQVKGKTRVIRQGAISWRFEGEIDFIYAGFNIEIRAQETGGFYIRANNPEISFGTAVDGYFDEWSSPRPVETFEDAISLALANIL